MDTVLSLLTEVSGEKGYTKAQFERALRMDTALAFLENVRRDQQIREMFPHMFGGKYDQPMSEIRIEDVLNLEPVTEP